MVDLARRYSKRADLHKLEAARAAIDSGTAPARPRRRRKSESKPEPQAPRRIERRLSRATIDALIHAYRDGASTAQLATRFTISKTAVLELLSRHIVPRRYQSMTHADIDHAERLYLAGHSLVTCGKLTGFPASTIKDALHKRGTPMRPAGGRPHARA